MTVNLLEVTALLAAVAALPVIATTGIRPATLFLCPLGGALLAAWSAEFELIVGGSFLTAFLVMAAVVNGAVVVYYCLRHFGKHADRGRGVHRRPLLARDPNVAPPAIWMVVTVAAVAFAVIWPLQALRVPAIGYDANVIWLLHAILIYGGHSSLVSGINNPLTAHPDYPPLVPASSAVGFVLRHGVDLRLGVGITAVLNACGLGVLGSGIAEIAGRSMTAWRRVIVLAAAVAICLVGFGIAGQFAVDGFADLAWAAPAAAAVVFGLVLPRSTQHFFVAWICLTVAALAKNEGLVGGLTIAVLLAVRYIPTTPGTPAWTWARRAVGAFVVALPCLTWKALMQFDHVSSDVFLRGVPGQPPRDRVGPTISASTHYLHILPAALLVLLLAGALFRGLRRNAGLANPAWLWTVAAANLAALIGTYVFGALEIHYWLASSLNRTTIFTQLILFTDVTVWAALAALPPRPATEQQQPSAGSEATASALEMEPEIPATAASLEGT